MHPLEYKSELEAMKSMETYGIMADFQVKTFSGNFIQQMVAAIGLTVHQVRALRDNAIYERYLDRTRAAFAAESSKVLFGVKTQKMKASISPHFLRPTDASLNPPSWIFHRLLTRLNVVAAQ